MRALRVVKAGDIELKDDVPEPHPGAGEVRLKVAAAGMCGTDVELRPAPAALGVKIPWTLGHEVAGHVDELGDGVDDVTTGTFVSAYPLTGCGHCKPCRRGEDNLCRTQHVTSIGVHRDGGLADYVVIPAHNATDATGIAPDQAATLTDAGLTSYRAIKLGRDIVPDAEIVVVTGIGGLGHMAVQILKATTSTTVIAVDTDDAKLQLAHELGADHTVKSDTKTAAAVMDIAGGRQVDITFDFVGVQPTLDLARDVTGNGGTIIIPGVGNGTLAINAKFGDALGFEVSAKRTVNGSRPDLAEVLDLARKGKLHTRTTSFTLDHALDGLDQLSQGKIVGRAVVMIDPS